MAEPAAAAEPAASSGTPAPAGGEIPVTPAGNGGAGNAPAKVPSELARALRQVRQLTEENGKLKATTPAAAPAAAPTRESLLADLKKRYDEDPEAFLSEVTGEDFYALAGRVAKRGEPVEETVASLAKKLADIENKVGARDTKETAAEKAEAAKVTQKLVDDLKTVIEATDDAGDHVYPTLASQDPVVLKNLPKEDRDAFENPAQTAYDAVTYAWLQEGSPQWSPEEVQKRFTGAFEKLEAYCSGFSTSRDGAPKPKEPEEPDTAPQPHTAALRRETSDSAPGTMSIQAALAKAMREEGIRR
jgi:hypothetical protein